MKIATLPALARATLLGLLFSQEAACALTDYHLKAYAPVTVTAVAAVSQTVVWDGLEVVPTFSENAAIIGVKKNGYGNELGKIFAQPDPKAWLENAVRTEFQAAGIAFGGGTDAPRVKVRVQQFFAEPDVQFFYIGVVAVTSLTVQVTMPKTGQTFERHFVGRADQNQYLFVVDSDFDNRYFDSAQAALHEAAVGIQELLTKGVS